MTSTFDRRAFLKASALTGVTMAFPSFTAAGGGNAKTLLDLSVPSYTTWQDIMRKQWTWDKVVRGTHIVNCWYQAHCAWDVYVKDGLVFREEQAAEYEKLNDELPDYNPRGCQKGGCYSDRIYDPTRITHPLRRVGPRGGGKFERVSWDEALTDIANSWLDVAVEEGTDRVIWDVGPAADAASLVGAVNRLAVNTQSVALDGNTEIGDGHRGMFETFGKIVVEGSADDYFYSDLILMWAGNPIFTQIPNAHFFTEAKYRGARIISIAPDYNPSSIKADLWIHIKPATDAALALGVAHILIEEGKINHDFVCEQTDLPMLVREDNHHFLTEADLIENGRASQFYVIDKTSGEARPMPSKTLALEALKPELDGVSSVRLKNGTDVAVRTVFSRLRQRLADYSPEKVAAICGTTPVIVRRLAQEIASAKRMRNTTQSVFSKLYHGNLAERAIILIFALTGHIGRKGAGISGFPMMTADGFEEFISSATKQDFDGTSNEAKQVLAMVMQRMAAGETFEMILYDLTRLGFYPGIVPTKMLINCSGTLFWQVHGGVSELSDNEPDWGRKLKRQVNVHLAESLAKGWQSCHPAPGNDPRIMFSVASNPFRRIRGSQKLVERLLPKLKKYVVLDWRMNSSGRFADYVLPVASWYENTNFKWVTPLSPYLTVSEQATKPLGESKSDWEVCFLLAKKLQEIAVARGISEVKTPHGLKVNFSTLYENVTMQGEFTENDSEKLLRNMYERDNTFGEVTWDQFKKKGFARFTKLPNNIISVGNQCDIPPNDSIVALTNHVVKKMPYPTTTRRIQFYLDHPLYHEYDEVLPGYKASPTIGGEFPLVLTGGKTRWSIHSAWRDSRILMRLSRPEPYVLMSIQDAARRGIVDHAPILVRNDVGEFEANAKVTPTLQPGQALMYHAWERHQFRSKGDMNSVSPSPINPVELAGGAGQHLRPYAITGQASMFDRETRVEIVRMETTR